MVYVPVPGTSPNGFNDEQLPLTLPRPNAETIRQTTPPLHHTTSPFPERTTPYPITSRSAGSPYKSAILAISAAEPCRPRRLSQIAQSEYPSLRSSRYGCNTKQNLQLRGHNTTPRSGNRGIVGAGAPSGPGKPPSGTCLVCKSPTETVKQKLLEAKFRLVFWRKPPAIAHTGQVRRLSSAARGASRW